MLYHYVQQKPSELEEIGRSEKPNLDQKSLIPNGERRKLSDQGDKEDGEKAERETVGRALLGDIRTELKQKKPKQEREQINKDFAGQLDMSRHGQDETYVGDDQRESLNWGRRKEADKTHEKEGVYEQVPSVIREEKEEGGYSNHNQQDSSILGTIKPEQV